MKPREDELPLDDVFFDEEEDAEEQIEETGLDLDADGFADWEDMLVDDAKPLRLCKHCQKVFLGSRANSAFCSARCKNQYNVYKTRAKSREDKENG